MENISTALDCFSLLQNSENIDLRNFSHHLSLVADVNSDHISKSLIFKAMSDKELLSPEPEVFWRVDRNLLKYRERVGIDILKLIYSIQETSTLGDVILELGAGCGYADREIRSARVINDFFSIFSINDIIYFPIRSFIGRVLNFRHGDESLSEKAKSQVIDYVYKILSLEKGTTMADYLKYDETFFSLIKSDVNNLIPALLEINVKLNDAVGVPSEYGGIPCAPEKTKYPNKIFFRDLDPLASEYIYNLSESPERYINSFAIASDLYEYLPVDPVGMLIGNFLELNKLADNSLAFVFSVKGTTYLADDTSARDFSYSYLLIQILKKLQKGGVYLDDGVRENFGKRYRLPELLRVQKSIDESQSSDMLWLIIGPGLSGDDFNQEAAIRSVAMTKGNNKPNVLTKNLADERFSVRAFIDVIDDDEYLRTLDARRSNYCEVKEAIA